VELPGDAAASVIVLTGGEATRMRPLSLDCSKPMLPYFGRPLLAYLLHDLSRAGLRRVFITHPGKQGDIRRYFGDGGEYGLSLEYLQPRAWGGTAGAVVSLLEEERPAISNPAVVIYGDSLLRMDYRALIDFHIAKEASMTLACHRPRFSAFLYEPAPDGRERTNFGIAELQFGGRIAHFAEKPELNSIPATFALPAANAAVYVSDPDAIRSVPPPATIFDFAYDVIPWLVRNGNRVFGLDIAPGFRVDMGTLPNYLSFHLAMLRGAVPVPQGDAFWRSHEPRCQAGATLEQPVFIGEDVSVGASAVVAFSVIGDHCVISDGAQVRESVVLADAVIGSGAVVEGSVIGSHSRIAGGTKLPRGSVTSSWSHIGGPELVLSPETIRSLIFSEMEAPA